ncbi:MAG: WD40 repeat domain-containing protein [Planctomycetaceae bacterium]
MHQPRGVAISRDGRWLAAAGQDSFTAIFDLKTRQQVNPPGDGHSHELLSVRFAGTKSLASSSDGDARVWDIKSGKQQQTLPLQDKTTTVRGLATSPDGSLIVTSAFDDTLGVWDRATGKRLREVPIPPQTKPLAVSADRRWIAAGESRRDEQGNTTSTAIVLRDRATLKVVREWPVSDPREAAANVDPDRKPSISHVAETDNGMAFSPDSRFLAWSRLDALPGIDIVEVEHDRLHASIPVESPVWCLDFRN